MGRRVCLCRYAGEPGVGVARMRMHEQRHQLEWVTHNRARPVRTIPVARLVQYVVEGHHSERDTIAEGVAPQLAGLVDGAFKDHCRIGGVQKGTLMIHVNRAALVYPMRLRWQSLLANELGQRRGGPTIGRVRFTFGTAGVRIPETDDVGRSWQDR